METEALAAAAHADFSMWALFWRATLTVKLVMIVLVIASVWGWAVIIDKFRQYARARRETQRFEAQFWSGDPLDSLFDEIDSMPMRIREMEEKTSKFRMPHHFGVVHMCVVRQHLD